jgi:hypothetical protein
LLVYLVSRSKRPRRIAGPFYSAKPSDLTSILRAKVCSALCTVHLARGIECLTAAVTNYPDEAKELSEEGVDLVFNLYSEAGSGFAAHACKTFADKMGALRRPPTS